MAKKLMMFLIETVAAVVGIAALSGCVTNTTVHMSTDIQRWKCGDYVQHCYFDCPITLSGDFNLGTGTVTFAGTTEVAEFQLQGVELRWDWCLKNDGAYDCAFVISADGTGSFYNFHGFEKGTRIKPSDLFYCTKQ